MAKKEFDIQQLLERHAAGKLLPEELEFLEKWYEQLDLSSGETWQSDAHEIHTRKTLHTAITDNIEHKPIHKTSIIKLPWLRSAAAVVLLAIGTFWITRRLANKPQSPYEKKEVASTPSRQQQIDPRNPAPQLVLVHTGAHQRRKVLLPDSSVVWLNASSTIKYPAAFSLAGRDVFVEKGEVFFNITRDAGRPFVVHTGSIATTVLGTSFVVKQSYKQHTLEIAVRTGKVKVEKILPGSNPITIGTSLLSADRLRFDTTANRYELSKEPMAEIGAFINGKLIYSDASLAEIVHDLGNKYNVNITLATNKLKDCRYQISFDDIPLSECLELLGTLTNARIDQLDSRHYVIDGDSCN